MEDEVEPGAEDDQDMEGPGDHAKAHGLDFRFAHNDVQRDEHAHVKGPDERGGGEDGDDDSHEQGEDQNRF